MSSRSKLAAVFLLLPAAILFALAYITPLASMAGSSVYKNGTISLSSYRELIESASFTFIVWRTLRVAGTVTIIALVIGYPMAYALARLRGWRLTLAVSIITIPYLTSVLIRSYAWVVILGNKGLVNQSLIFLGVIDQPVKLVFNDFGTYLGMVQIQLPLMIFPLYASFRKLDPTLRAAARNLGSGPFNAFLKIDLPLSAPGIASGCILVFLSCIGFYVTPALLGGPGEYLVAQAIHARISVLADFDSAAAQATVLLIAVLGIAVIFRRQIIENALGTREGDHMTCSPETPPVLS